MQDRGINGSTDWTRYEIELDVADEAIAIFFGALHTGESHLRRSLGNDYVAIGFAFNRGSFQAIAFVDETTRARPVE